VSGWVAQPEAIRLGVTSVNSLLSHASPFSTIRTSLQQSGSPSAETLRKFSPKLDTCARLFRAEDVLAHKTSQPLGYRRSSALVLLPLPQ